MVVNATQPWELAEPAGDASPPDPSLQLSHGRSPFRSPRSGSGRHRRNGAGRFGYPQADGVDILDNIRTNTGNEQGPPFPERAGRDDAQPAAEVKNQRYEAQMGWANLWLSS